MNMEVEKRNGKMFLNTSLNKILPKEERIDDINTPSYRRSVDEKTERRNESVTIQNLSHFRDIVDTKPEDSIKIKNNSSSSQVILKFFDESILIYDISLVIECCPAISPFLIQRNYQKNIQVEIPSWITSSNMIEYFLYINDDRYLNFRCSVNKLLSIADYFNNQNIITKILKTDIIPNLNNDDTILYLEYSYNKLSNNTDNYAWFDLFYESINSIATNLPFYLNTHYDKIQEMKLEILEEIVEKFLQIQHNNLNNVSFSLQNYEKIIKLLCNARGTDNIYDLIKMYQDKLLSNELIEELSNLKPNLKIKISKNDPHLTYKEFPDIQIDKQVFNFGLFAHSLKNFLKINYNVKYPQNMDNNLKILSVLTVVDVKNEHDKRSVKLKSFYCDKNQTYIYQDNKLSSSYGEESELTFKVYIKVCYTYSLLQNYFLFKFPSFYNNEEISRLSKNQIKSILFNKYLQYDNYSEVLKCLNLWLKEQKNMKGNLNILFENILWDKISISVIIEFIIQFTPLIEKFELMNFFQHMIDSKISLNYKNRNHQSLEDDCSLFYLIFNACRNIVNNKSDMKNITIHNIYENQLISRKNSDKYSLQETNIEPKFKLNIINPLKFFPLASKRNNDIDPKVFNSLSGSVSNNCSHQPSYRNFDTTSKGVDLEYVIKNELPKNQKINQEIPLKISIPNSNKRRNRNNNLSVIQSIKTSNVLNTSKIQLKNNALNPRNNSKTNNLNSSFNNIKNKQHDYASNLVKLNLSKDDSLHKFNNDLIKNVKRNYNSFIKGSNINLQRNSNNSSCNSKNLYSCETSSNKTNVININSSKDFNNRVSDSKKITISVKKKLRNSENLLK